MALFTNTQLGATLQTMSTAKFIPKGLKPQACGRGRHMKPPIAYIPERDIVDSPYHTLKIKVSHYMHIKVTIFHEGTPEQFLSHVHIVLETTINANLTRPNMMPSRKT